jgi:hypothetical protein
MDANRHALDTMRQHFTKVPAAGYGLAMPSATQDVDRAVTVPTVRPTLGVRERRCRTARHKLRTCTNTTRDAKLSGTNLTGAITEGADFARAHLAGVIGLQL